MCPPILENLSRLVLLVGWDLYWTSFQCQPFLENFSRLVLYSNILFFIFTKIRSTGNLIKQRQSHYTDTSRTRLKNEEKNIKKQWLVCFECTLCRKTNSIVQKENWNHCPLSIVPEKHGCVKSFSAYHKPPLKRTPNVKVVWNAWSVSKEGTCTHPQDEILFVCYEWK